MLKERIEFLCRKKDITRKELVEGLVTQAHFANILAERYPLAEDLAVHIAQRLGVAPSYLSGPAAADEQALQRAERIFDALSVPAASLPEQAVNDIPDRDDALAVELTTALMKAVYYQQMNDGIAHEYLHRNYLNFYLEKFVHADDSRLPAPAEKALLYYKVQFFRSKSRYDEALASLSRLAGLLTEGSEIWLSAQNMTMEACIRLKQYEQAGPYISSLVRSYA